ncbi:MAG: hypothetical protein ACPL1Y_02195 [Thermoplasmata archaeon]
MPTKKSVSVSAFARLHLGIIDMSKRRRYGAIGVYLNKPQIRVLARFSYNFEVSGCTESAEYLDYIRKVAENVFQHFGLKERVNLQVEEIFPLHVGLGGRTQCGLAVANAILSLYELKADLFDISEMLGIGKYTAVGVHAFRHGGFIIETGCVGGKHTALHLNFPEEWSFVVGIPEGRGLGEAEEKVHMESIACEEKLCREICENVLLEMVPGILAKDIERFGRGLNEVQRIVGMCFSEIQGGIFSKVSAHAIQQLREAGAYGVGQSSWGPTVYGLFKKEDAESVATRLKTMGEKAKWFAASVRNRGAVVE